MDLGRVAATESGRWQTAPLSAALAVLPGDTIEVEGTTAWLKRNGHYIDSREIGEPTEYTPVPMSEPHTLTDVIFWRQDPMPAASATCTDVTINQTTGAVRAKFSDGGDLEYADFASLEAEVIAYDTNPDHAKKLLLLKAFRNSPDGTNLDAIVGSSCTIDGQAQTPVQFSLTV